MTESSPTEQTNALLAAVVASLMDAVFSIDTNARITAEWREQDYVDIIASGRASRSWKLGWGCIT
jgi:hypothetical protein